MSGFVLLPGDHGYDAARQIHNGTIDKHPAVIVRCLGVADVQDAVRFAQQHDLPIAIRGGGHNVAGRAVVDDGLMIDLSLMKAVIVDSVARTAQAQPGVTWGDFNRETQVHGLATTGGVVSTTGIAGLTLGGGLGWLMGRFGLTVDNLRGVELVTADGQVIQAREGENDDLFWAIRGGGGNFGVVTRFDYNLHEVGPMVTGGLIAFPFDQAKQVLRNFREFANDLPDELVVFAGLVHAPDGSGTKLAAVLACHSGTPDDGAATMNSLRSFGTPAMDMQGPIPYTAQNGILDDAFPKGARNYWKSSFMQTLSVSALDTIVDAFAQAPSPMTGLVFEHFHGAAVRPSPTDTAFAYRAEGHNLLLMSQSMDTAEDDANIQWTRDLFDAVASARASDVYVNYLDGDEPASRVAEAYGVNYPRLQQIKKKYDPANVFKLNQNIEPA